MSKAPAHHEAPLPPRAAAWGLLTTGDFFGRPRPAREDGEDTEPSTKHRCVEATTTSILWPPPWTAPK